MPLIANTTLEQEMGRFERDMQWIYDHYEDLKKQCGASQYRLSIFATVLKMKIECSRDPRYHLVSLPT